MAVDGSLTWLLDEFDTMSVTRSNSLRHGSPPIQPRRDSSTSAGGGGGGGGGQENGDPHHRHHSHTERQDRLEVNPLFRINLFAFNFIIFDYSI